MTDEIEVRWKLVERNQKTGWLAFNFTAVSFDKRNHGGTENTKEHGEKKLSFVPFVFQFKKPRNTKKEASL